MALSLKGFSVASASLGATQGPIPPQPASLDPAGFIEKNKVEAPTNESEKRSTRVFVFMSFLLFLNCFKHQYLTFVV